MCIYYSVYYECKNRNTWGEYIVDSYEDEYKDIINDIKFTIREYGGGTATIYENYGDEFEKVVDQLTVAPCPAAIYKYGDKVSFLLNKIFYEGTIEIVDAFGTFFDNSQPYYDIYIILEGEKILVKHVPQSYIRRANV